MSRVGGSVATEHANGTPDQVPRWSTRSEAFRLFAHGVTVRTAGKVALVVGTILSVVNQGETIADGSATWLTWVRVAVNYCVPFCVASIGFLAARRMPPGIGGP